MLPEVEALVEAEEARSEPEDEKAALLWLHASRMVEAAAKSLVEQSGLFLNAMAAGHDKHWPAGSLAKDTATKLRNELGALLGGPPQVGRS